MTTIEALKDVNKDIRLTNNDKWMVWGDNSGWVVFQAKKYSKSTKVLIETKDEAEAIQKLIEND